MDHIKATNLLKLILDREPSKHEKESLIERLTIHQNPTNLDILEIIARIAAHNESDTILHDYFKEEVKMADMQQEQRKTSVVSNFTNLMDIFTQKSMSDMLSKFNPAALYKKTYIQLDTRNAAYFDNNKAVWYISKSQNIQQGFINTKASLCDIIQIRLVGGFIYTNYMYSETGSGDNDMSTRRLSFYIEELGQSAFSQGTNIKFHSLGYTTHIQTSLTIQPILSLFDTIYYITAEEQFNNGLFQFDQPVSIFDKVTLMVSDLKRYIHLAPRNIEIVNNIDIATSLNPQVVMRCYNTDNRITLYRYQYIQYVTLPDITTVDPVADAAWITAMRTGVGYLYYDYPEMHIFMDVTILPTTAIQPYTIRFPVGLKVSAEFEITYIDSSL